MRVSQRLIAATVLLALSGALAGCGGGSALNDFDPTDMFNFLDTKKKLPGERRAVFPEGVPGVDQGVPKDLYKGAQEQQLQQAPPVAEAAPEPPPQRSRATRHSSTHRAAPAAPAQQDAEEGAQVATKPTPAPKRKRTRITAPEQEQPAPQQQTQQQPQPQQSAPQQQQQDLRPFPAPLPSGSFQR